MTFVRKLSDAVFSIERILAILILSFMVTSLMLGVIFRYFFKFTSELVGRIWIIRFSMGDLHWRKHEYQNQQGGGRKLYYGKAVGKHKTHLFGNCFFYFISLLHFCSGLIFEMDNEPLYPAAKIAGRRLTDDHSLYRHSPGAVIYGYTFVGFICKRISKTT